MTLLALLCVVINRPTLAGFWFRCSITAKIYPIILLPIFSAYYLAGIKYHELLMLLATIGTTCLIMLSFWLLAPENTLSFVLYHKLRGLQIETVPAGIISLANILRLTQVKQVENYGASHLVSPLTEERVPLADRAVLGQGASRLAHEPDRRALNRLEARYANEEGRAHREEACP